MTNCSFTASSRTVSSITAIADSLNTLIVKNMIILSKSVMTFRNVMSVLLQNTAIVIICSKAVSLHTAVSTVILSTQLDSSNAESAKNN